MTDEKIPETTAAAEADNWDELPFEAAPEGEGEDAAPPAPESPPADEESTAEEDAPAEEAPAAANEQTSESAPQSARSPEQRNADFVEFLKSEYRAAAEEIPKEVWDSYKTGGGTLVQAYVQFENRRLKTELEALKKAAENRARSTGSLLSAGKTTAQDEFDRLWHDGT